MKKNLFIPAALSALLLCGCQLFRAKKEKLVLSIDSNYRIVLPDRYASPECRAGLTRTAEQLQHSLKSALGREFPIVYEKQVLNAPGNSIYLGDTDALRKLGVKLEKMGSMDTFIGEDADDIYIAGPDKRKGGGSLELGTLRGTVVFEERFLQTRFLYPGELGREYAGKPGKAVLKTGMREFLPSPLEFAPGGLGIDPFYDAAVSNFGGDMFSGSGECSFRTAVPAGKYFKVHPEYFALKNGRRSGEGGQLCISNPAVGNLIRAGVLNTLDKGAKIVRLTPGGSYRSCECARCRAGSGTVDPAEKLWIFYLALAEHLKEARPGKKLLLRSPEGNMPPKSFREFPDNVIVELCGHDFAAVAEAWKEIRVPGGFAVCLRNWGSDQTLGYTPKRTPAFVQKQIADLKRIGIRGISSCRFGENMGLEAPVYYIFGKLLNDPSRSAEQIFGEYCSAAFQESAQPMKEFFRALYGQLDLYMTTGNKLENRPVQALSMIYTADLLQTMEQHLASAEKAAKSRRVRMRLRWVRAEFDYVKNLSDCLALAGICRRFPVPANSGQFSVLLEKRRAMVRKITGFARAEKMKEKFIPEWPEAALLRDSSTVKQLPFNGSQAGVIRSPLNQKGE